MSPGPWSNHPFEVGPVKDDMYIEERDGMFKKGWDWMDVPYRQYNYTYMAEGIAALDSRFMELLGE